MREFNSQSVVAAAYSALLSFLSNSGSASRRLHFFVATKKAKQRKRPLLNRPAGTRLRRYEIQPEADRFGILPQLPISPLPAGTQVCRCCRELTTAHGSTLRAFFSLYFIGLEREFGAILMVPLPFQAFQKATRSPTKLSLSTVGTCLQAIF
ncbi:MAG: hypothetical protein ACJAWL_000083 [Motiliproteus sp.]|jgi:hypothetical protein